MKSNPLTVIFILGCSIDLYVQTENLTLLWIETQYWDWRDSSCSIRIIYYKTSLCWETKMWVIPSHSYKAAIALFLKMTQTKNRCKSPDELMCNILLLFSFGPKLTVKSLGKPPEHIHRPHMGNNNALHMCMYQVGNNTGDEIRRRREGRRREGRR